MKLPLRTLSVAFMAISAGLLTQPRATAQIHHPNTTIPCPDGVPPGEIESETITCGILTVPENYDEPDGRQIELTYAVLHSRSLSPAPDPVIDLRGGPGATVLTAPGLESRASFYQAQRTTRDVIIFDQRGTQFSNRLGCAPVAFALVTAAQDPSSELVASFNTLFEEVQAAFPGQSDFNIVNYTRAAICAALLEAHGVDLNQYKSPNSAQDVMNLAAALGYDDINLYGISYGTYLAMQIMRDHPDRLRSVVLDSTLPPHVDKYESIPLDAEIAFSNLVEDCEADAACAEAYPDLKARTAALLNQLETDPIPLATEPEASVTAASLANLIAQINGQPTTLPAYLPLIIDELEQGVTTTYEAALAGTLFDAAVTPAPPPDSIEAYQLEAKQYEINVQNLLREANREAQSQRPGSLWVEQVEQQLTALPEEEAALELVNFYGVGYQTAMPRDRATLQTFVADTFTGEVAQSLSDRLDTLSEVEVRHVYDVVSLKTDAVVPAIDRDLTVGMFYSVDCRETMPFSTPEEITAAYQQSELPQLGASRYASALLAYDLCRLWPVDPAPASEHTVLESDIPTLVLQGRYDIQTNSEMGAQAMDGLSNGTFVEFSSTGHGVIVWSQCARDIGVAFINDPDGETDTSCTANLFPNFVLPSE